MKGITEQDHTRVIRAKNFVLEALNVLELVEPENLNSEERIASITRTLEEAEDALADELKDYELETLKEQGKDAEQAPESALHWAVYAETHGASVDHCGLMGAFYTKSDAEEYAARLDADTLHKWSVTVEEIA